MYLTVNGRTYYIPPSATLAEITRWLQQLDTLGRQLAEAGAEAAEQRQQQRAQWRQMN